MTGQKPKIAQISPDQAKDKTNCHIQLKYDGIMAYYINNRLFSHRMNDITDKYKHIVGEIIHDVILVGEIYVPDGNVFTVSTKTNYGKAKFVMFDIIKFDNEDIKSKRYSERLATMKDLVADTEIVHFPKEFPNFETGWKWVEENKAEGLVLKEDTAYGEGLYKCKLLQEFKLEILDFDNPNGKKGAFILEGGSRCDALSGKFVEEFNAIKGMGGVPIAEVEAPFLTREGKLFQPRLRRIYNDRR